MPRNSRVSQLSPRKDCCLREQLSSGARGVKAVRSRASLAGGDLLGRRALEPWRVASHELALKKKAGGLDALAVGADDFLGREGVLSTGRN